jgi:hypothetical protein
MTRDNETVEGERERGGDECVTFADGARLIILGVVTSIRDNNTKRYMKMAAAEEHIIRDARITHRTCVWMLI